MKHKIIMYDETHDNLLKVIRLNIYPYKKNPYFFIKNAIDDKRYRISISFKYLNEHFGINIGIIRNTQNIKQYITDFKIVDTICMEQDTQNINNLTITYFDDLELNDTILYKIEKNFNNIIHDTVVFFSKKYNNIDQYLEQYSDQYSDQKVK